MSSNSNATYTLHGFTKAVWCRHIGHTKVNKGVLHGGFSRGKTHDVRRGYQRRDECLWVGKTV